MYLAQFCGGVLIDATWILIAAHCVIGKTAGEVDVAVGVFDLDNFSGSRMAVKNIRIHPHYNDINHKNDIALLELSLSSTQPAVSLFSGESQEQASPSMVGRMLTAIGWGMADSNDSWYWPEKLRQVNLPVVTDGTCNIIYQAPASPLSSSQFCAGYDEGKDVCNGDSGGPVVSKIDGVWAHMLDWFLSVRHVINIQGGTVSIPVLQVLLTSSKCMCLMYSLPRKHQLLPGCNFCWVTRNLSFMMPNEPSSFAMARNNKYMKKP